MRLATGSPRIQRFLGGGVAALLTASAFAFATVADDGTTSAGRFRDVEAVAIPERPPAGPVELALITTTEGRSFLADPSTPEGRRAIRDARREGATVREVTVPAPEDGDGGTAPATGGERRVALPGITPGSGGGSAPLGSDTGGLVEIDTGLLDDLLDDPVGTLRDLVVAIPSTLTSVVRNVGTTVSTLLPTVSSVVGTVGATASSVVSGVGTTVSSLVGVLTPTTAAPSPAGGLLGGLLGLVTGGQSASTTESPTTSPAPDPVCTLLVFCH